MAKTLRVMVILILLLSAAALTLGIMLFMQREVLKGRTQKLENSHLALSKSLHYDKLTLEQMKANKKEELDNIDKPLKDLNSFAVNTYETLQETKKNLADTKAKLAKTEEELATTKTQLAAANTEIAGLKDTVTKKDAEITEKTGKITALEGEKTALQGSLDEANKKIAKNEADITELHAQIKDRDLTIKDLNAQLGRIYPIPRGTTGKILSVSPDWKFAVLDIGRDNGLWPNAEMLIHRGTNLLGRVRIGIVHKKVAIADILSDYATPGAVVQEGDRVLY
jgi:peptidoglycan hydrolase CwlO-like protein